MASEATKMAVRGNMHMDARVVEVTEFNSEVEATRGLFHKISFRGEPHCSS